MIQNAAKTYCQKLFTLGQQNKLGSGGSQFGEQCSPSPSDSLLMNTHEYSQEVSHSACEFPSQYLE